MKIDCNSQEQDGKAVKCKEEEENLSFHGLQYDFCFQKRFFIEKEDKTADTVLGMLYPLGTVNTSGYCFTIRISG